MIEREAKAGRPVTVMIFDIDHFKSINDRFGHPAGDEMLKLFSAVVVNNLRITDLSGRIGGEEFAALLPCPLEEGVLVAERVREAFETSGIVVRGRPGRYHRQHRRRRRAGRHRARGAAGGRPTPRSTRPSAGGRNRVEAAEELPLSLENWRRKTAGIAAPAARPATA